MDQIESEGKMDSQQIAKQKNNTFVTENASAIDEEMQFSERGQNTNLYFTILRTFRIIGALIQKKYLETKLFARKYSKQVYSALSFVMIIFVLLTYSQFKEKCPYDTQQKCLNKFIKVRLTRWLSFIVIDSVIAVLQFYLLFKKKAYTWISVAGVLQTFYLYIYSDQTISNTNYIGAINVLHLFWIFLLSVALGIGFCIKKAFQRFRWKAVGFIFLIFLFIGVYWYFQIVNSCDYWTKGINGAIQTGEGLCNIKVPPYCWYKPLNGILDATVLLHDCGKGAEKKQNFEKYFSESLAKGEFIGLPNFAKFTKQERMDDKIQSTVFEKSQGFASLQAARSDANKYDIIFDSQQQTYHIGVQRNQTLVQERKQIWEKFAKENGAPLAKNVLILYVDTIGRQMMHLKLPKMVSWFKKRTVQKSYEKDNFVEKQNIKQESFEFYRYNSYLPWTGPNMFSMFYGQRFEGLKKRVDEEGAAAKANIFQEFQERGYIVGSTNTFCQTISMQLNVQKNLKYYNVHGFDHQLSAFACDPNFHDPNNPYSIAHGIFASGQHCLYEKLLTEYVVEASESFYDAYKEKDIPKVLILQFLEGHQGTAEVIRYIDDPVYQMLIRLQKKGYLQDTVVALISDHGNHMEGLLAFFKTENAFTEKNLPGLMIRLPESVNQQYRDTIRRNQQLFITATNFYHTMLHLIKGEEYTDKKLSLLSDLTNKTSCQLLGVTDYQCRCK